MGENDVAADFDRGFSRVSPHRFLPGEMLGGKYKIISLLGQGGMGCVYRVEQIFLNKDMALKTLNSASASTVTLQRFQLEAKAASAIRHPNLVEVHDFGLLNDGRPYLVMDFIEGISLAEYLKEHGPLNIKDVTPVFAQACFGLLAAHERGIVHRDIKPGNIMLLKNRSLDSDGSVKVVDFGIAKVTGQEADEVQSLTRTGDVFGSPLYMSPEQCMGGAVDQRSDIYSLGCVLFEMLTGTPPHVGQNALNTMKLHESGRAPTLREASLGKQFPDALEQIVAKMLAKLPGERYQNIGLVAHDLASVGKGRSVSDLLHTAKVTKPIRIISMNERQFVLMMISIVLATTAVSGFFGYQFKRYMEQSDHGDVTMPARVDDSQSKITAVPTNKTGPERKPLEDDLLLTYPQLDAEAKAAIENAGPVRAVLVNGGREKTFEFPKCGIGILCQFQTIDSNKELRRASGSVSVLSNIPLMLKIQGHTANAVIDTPAFFSKIDPNEFLGLIITGSDDEIHSVSSIRNLRAKNFEEIAKILTSWSRLETMTLDNLPIDSTATVTFNKLKHLRHFRLTRCLIDAPSFARQTFLGLLKSLIIADIKNIDAVVRSAAKSGNLQYLCLGNTGVTADTIRELQHCSTLDTLILQEEKFDDQIVEAIVSLHYVSKVGFQGTLTPRQLATLVKCSHLQKIGIQGTGLTNEKRLELTRSSPKIGFMPDAGIALTNSDLVKMFGSY
jgi:hypothetical protein